MVYLLAIPINVFLTHQTLEEEERSKYLTEGEWVSVSVEMERWNLLIYQLDDLVAVKCFIIDLSRQLKDRKGKLETGSAPKLSVLGMVIHSKKQHYNVAHVCLC